MKLLSPVLSFLFSWLSRQTNRLLQLDISLDDVALDEQELAEELRHGRD